MGVYESFHRASIESEPELGSEEHAAGTLGRALPSNPVRVMLATKHSSTWGKGKYPRELHIGPVEVTTVEPGSNRVTNRWRRGDLVAARADGLRPELWIELPGACCGPSKTTLQVITASAEAATRLARELVNAAI